MRVLIVSPGQDTGGQGIRIKEAFDRHGGTDWHVDAMRLADNYIHYPTDLDWDEQKALDLYERADVVHHKNGMLAYPLLDVGARKPAILHHQGSRLRKHPREVSGEGVTAGATQIVSTVDLLADAPGSTWLPTPYDLDWLRDRYRRPHGSGRIRIGHAPTNYAAKNTSAIMKALDVVARKHPIEVDLIEQARWKVCLSRKGLCDIFIDQITLGYGNNAVEAWAMGIPVVSGFAEPADRAAFVEQTGIDGDAMPFHEATAVNLVARIEQLVVDAELRAEVGRRGRAYAEAFHDERAIVERLKVLYIDAAKKPSHGAAAVRLYEDERVAI